MSKGFLNLRNNIWLVFMRKEAEADFESELGTNYDMVSVFSPHFACDSPALHSSPASRPIAATGVVESSSTLTSARVELNPTARERISKRRLSSESPAPTGARLG